MKKKQSSAGSIESINNGDDASNLIPFPIDDKKTKKSKLIFGCIIGAFIFLIYSFRSEFFPKTEHVQQEQRLSLLDLNFVPFVNKEQLPKGSLKFYTKNDKGDWESHNKSLNDFKGKPMVIHMWATFCGPCVKELPVYDSFVKSTSNDIAHIAVTTGKVEPKDIEAFYAQKNIKNLTIVVDEKATLAQTYQIQAIPTSIFFSASGKPLGYISGIISWEDGNVASLLMNLLRKA
ncbi:MAG: TlpA family protein disulfide reductase [Proteobacteria bacterium]|nr:TlpA family protein disulfide reductase [Pseudomonadota bacterium]